MNAIQLRGIRRVFNIKTGTIRRHAKQVVAIDGLSMDVGEGELFGLLGPNGAGKTTTIKILTTLLMPTTGTATVHGRDVVREAAGVRREIGFVFGGERGLYYRLSGRDNLRYFAELYRVPPAEIRRRVDELLEMVGLTEKAEESVEGYSRGMKQRLHLARTLVHRPRVLFLDEPTIGLDPIGARDIRRIVTELHRQGTTIILTTHYLFEADAMCERIGVIDKGRLVALGTPAELKANASDVSVVEVEVFGVGTDVVDGLRALDFVDSVVVEQRELRQLLRVQTTLGERAVAPLMAAMGGTQVGRVAVREATLEDAYVKLVGRVE
ncbi:MAG: type transport system ATP-binding protein [Chloroflexota bacterium]|nr:type transport system ATP-binding protein [Chloroflexota bacterium]